MPDPNRPPAGTGLRFGRFTLPSARRLWRIPLPALAPGNAVVAGVGAWGRNHARVLAELGALVGVCDPSPEIAEAVAAATGTRSLSWEQALDDPAVDAVVIAAPAALHHKLAREALMADKNVLVEKPLALHPDEGRELAALADKTDRVLMVGHLMRHHPAFIGLEDLAAAGTLGQIRYIHSSRLNLGRFRSEESILWSFAPHDISMILALTGSEPVKVEAVGGWFLGPDVPDVSTTHLWFADDVQAHIFVSWLHPVKEQRLVVVGTEGMAVLDDGLGWGSKLQIFDHRVDWIDGQPTPVRAEGRSIAIEPAEPLRVELTNFLRHVTDGTRPATDGAEGTRVLEVLRAAEDSLTQRRHG